MNMADAVARLGDFPAASTHFDESLTILRSLGDRWGEALALGNFGEVANRADDRGSARSLHERALQISRDVGDDRGVARALSHLADVARDEGKTGEAKALYRDSLAIRQSLGDIPGIAVGLEKLAWVVLTEDVDATARLLGCADALRAAIHVSVPATRADRDGLLRALATGLDQGRFEAARTQGRAMTPEEALATLPP
jgi:tetratricopeptide (TPR) repeat protein